MWNFSKYKNRKISLHIKNLLRKTALKEKVSRKNYKAARCSNQSELKAISAWKVSKYGVFPGLYFPAFGLNTERYFVSLRIQLECEKIRSEKAPYLDSIYAVYCLSNLANILWVNVKHQVSILRWQNKFCWKLDLLTKDVTSIDFQYFLLICLFSTLFQQVT